MSCVLGTVGLAATGTLYGALSAGLRVRETLLPFLLLPIAAPVLLAGTRIWQAAMAGGTPSDGTAVAAAAASCSTPSTWPSAWSCSGPSRRRHDQDLPPAGGSPPTATSRTHR